jgi:hypothetical protein
MKIKLPLLAAGIFLAGFATGLGQSTFQCSTNYFHVIGHAGLAGLIVQRASGTNAAVGVDFATNCLAFTNGPSGPQLGGSMNEWAVSQFQGVAEDGMSSRPSPQIRTEAGDQPTVSYSARLELRAATPINVVRSKKYSGVEYSGILVQAAKSNPLQLINPFAPANYGDGEANVVRHFVTGEVEGLKLWRISF